MDFEDVWVVLEAAHGVDLAHDAGLHGGVDRLGLVDGVYEGARLVHFGEVAAAKVPAEEGWWSGTYFLSALLYESMFNPWKHRLSFMSISEV